MNVAALVVVVVFYAAILAVGLVAGYFYGVKGDVTEELASIAGRNLNLVVGVFTMAATSVGGGYLAGTTEYIATSGIAWTVYPFTILLAFSLASFVFAKPMRERRYITLLDPLQERFGDVMTGLLLIVALFAELLWGASILIALGTSLAVIIDTDYLPAMLVSAGIACGYTMFGQMVAVAYTDTLQLLLIILGMVLCTPFAMTNDLVGSLSATKDIWVGSIPTNLTASWVDYVVSQIFGGIPWNTLMMRILAAKSVRDARIVSLLGGMFSFIMAIPPTLLGITAVSTDWNATELGYDPIARGEAASLMPYVIRYLTPNVVAIIALAAIVAAVMSSMDSIVLSSSSMFTHNIYKLALRSQAGPKELRVVQVIAMLSVTAVCALMAIYVDSIAGIFVLTADVIYVVLFPQFVCSIFFKNTNAYGAFAGYVVGVVLRIGGGEPSLNLEPFIRFPYYSQTDGQLFPFKTFTMVMSFLTVIIISYFFSGCFLTGSLNPKWDITKKVFNTSTDPSSYDISSHESAELRAKRDRENASTDDIGFGAVNPGYTHSTESKAL